MSRRVIHSYYRYKVKVNYVFYTLYSCHLILVYQDLFFENLIVFKLVINFFLKSYYAELIADSFLTQFSQQFVINWNFLLMILYRSLIVYLYVLPYMLDNKKMCFCSKRLIVILIDRFRKNYDHNLITYNLIFWKGPRNVNWWIPFNHTNITIHSNLILLF